MDSITPAQTKPSLSEVENAKKQIVTQVSHYAPMSEEEKALDRRVNLKMDFTLLLILAIGFILLGIDKTNVGFVATSSFIEDANLHPSDIPNSLSLFSATYVPLQPVSAMIGRWVGPKWWVCTLMLIWGSMCIAHIGVNSSPTFLALRLLLGVGESGFTPTAYYYMSLFYPKFSLGFRMGLFSGMYSVAGAFAGLLAYGLLHLDSSVLKGWQTVFLFEGALTVLVAAVGLFALPVSPGTAWFLTAEERAHASKRMQLDDAHAGAESEDEAGITLRDLKDVLTDWKKLLIIVFNILSVLPVTAFTTFLPMIVEGMGYEGVKATLMAVPPFVVGTIGLVIIVYSSDHLKERSLHTVFGMSLGLIGCVVMATSHSDKLRYGFAHVCLAGVFVGGPLVAVWLASNTPGKAARSIILGINGWSNLAGVIAGQLFKSRYAPSYRYPLIVTMILIAVGMGGFCAMRALYMWENRRRRKIILSWDEQEYAEEQNRTDKRGDQKVTWVYAY
ncbi:major facilitator superfamily domain-containing protein [Aspergillus pseudoustus]|uniref:Major facilitator superfamily domain-containing protein n=1 Tax=Aspergillus pseudoustus TaxID=1810923 RepID=A0ABR4K5A0_9EURO